MNLTILPLESKINKRWFLGLEISVLNWSLSSFFYMWVDKNKSFLLSKRGGQEQWFLFIHELCPSFLSVFSSSQFPLPCLILSQLWVPFDAYKEVDQCNWVLLLPWWEAVPLYGWNVVFSWWYSLGKNKSWLVVEKIAGQGLRNS